MTALLPVVVTSGWASGVNAYATVLMLGLLGSLRLAATIAGLLLVFGVTLVALRARRERRDPPLGCPA